MKEKYFLFDQKILLAFFKNLIYRQHKSQQTDESKTNCAQNDPRRMKRSYYFGENLNENKIFPETNKNNQENFHPERSYGKLKVVFFQNL